MNVLIWVTHLLGVGHFHRAVRIARALVREGAQVTVATGGFPVANVRLGDFEVVQLLPLRSPDVTFKRLVGPDGRDVSEDYLARRRDELLELARRIRPHAILTELFPFGRWKFQSELVPLMTEQRARADRPAILASIRDILVPPKKQSRLATIRRLVLDHFDGILVHGDAGFIRLEETLPLAAEFSRIVTYTGYVVPDYDPDADTAAGTGEVLVSAGGSAFGGHLLATAIAAKPLTGLADARWRVLAGQGLSHEIYDALARAGAREPGVIVERARADFPEMLTRARLSVSQAGYNTVCDVLAAGIPGVFAPFAEADESEQSHRVELLAAHGLATLAGEDPLTPAGLAAAIDLAAARPPNPSAMPLLNGGANTAHAVIETARVLAHG